MNDTNKNYSFNPPGFMRPDRDDSINVFCAGCDNGQVNEECIDSLPLAMAYVPRQKWQMIYEQSKALMRGTIFQQLDLPFKGANRR